MRDQGLITPTRSVFRCILIVVGLIVVVGIIFLAVFSIIVFIVLWVLCKIKGKNNH